MEGGIEERIERFLDKGKTKFNRKLRYEVLSIFSSGEEYTIREVHEILLSRGLNVSYKSLCTFIGVLSTRLGILIEVLSS